MPNIKANDPTMKIVKEFTLQEIEDRLFNIFDMFEGEEHDGFIDGTIDKSANMIQDISDMLEERSESDAERLAIMCHMTVGMFASIIFNYNRWLEKIKEN